LAPRLAIEKWIRENDTTVTSPEDMMLGRVDPQGSLFEPEHLSGDLVTRGSFHDKLAACGHELICDDDFGGLYAPNRGRPSIMMRGLLLA
jgi:hypothetical protein